MKLKEVWKRMKAHLVNEPPAPAELPIPRPANGVEMGPGPENREFVIRLADGTYYAGPGVAPGEIERTGMAGRAQRFPSRWAALQAATLGPVFAHAIILRVEDPR